MAERSFESCVRSQATRSGEARSLSCQVRPDMPIQSKHSARVRCRCISFIAHNLMSPRRYCRVSFASYAGQALIICGVFEGLPDCYKALNRANELACAHSSFSFLMQISLTSLRNRTEQYLAQRAQPIIHSSDNQSATPLPPHILNAMYPRHRQRRAGSLDRKEEIWELPHWSIDPFS